MKILSAAVPCYNSAEYMDRCIGSLLKGGQDIEIIIVDDGSTDDTAKKADEYKKQYPDIIKVIHQENGGHGEAVNTGLKNASGLYFKVVDSDDWVKESALLEVIEKLKEIVGGDTVLDLLIANFVYEKEGQKKKKVMHYNSALPVNEMLTWDNVRHFRKGQYLLMHSVIYRTRLLKDCGLTLPSHTFYVDNLYVFEPLPYVKTLYYMDVNLYRYYIGREDQSVNEKVMISRIDQQIAVNKQMIDYVTSINVDNKKLYRYMLNYLEIMMVVSSILLIREGSKESLDKKKELWNYLKKKSFVVFFKLRSSMLGQSMNLPGKGGRKISIKGYKLAQRIVGFN
ncbi:MAG: glycosyltransferase family 2 protein [Lachnospiraceae bacterium]|nr:glycosyltransferase family 2 protein [Lachnospiraceae bacterium]